jgi:hypothetical protein
VLLLQHGAATVVIATVLHDYRHHLSGESCRSVVVDSGDMGELQDDPEPAPTTRVDLVPENDERRRSPLAPRLQAESCGVVDLSSYIRAIAHAEALTDKFRGHPKPLIELIGHDAQNA